MATTRVWALKGNMQRVIDYVCQAKKLGDDSEVFITNGGTPSSTGLFWEFNQNYGNENSNKNDIKGFHFQISFPPNEVTPEQCKEIAKEWIETYLKEKGGNYDYVLAVHTDKPHTHAHIIVNPKEIDTGKQLTIYYKKDLVMLKGIADEICKERGLSTLDSPSNKSKQYYEWLLKGDSHKAVVMKTFQNLVRRCHSYQDMKDYMTAIGFEINDDMQSQYKDGIFKFSANYKLYERDYNDEFQYALRVPYASSGNMDDMVMIDKENVKFSPDGRTMFIEMNMNDYDKVNIFHKDINKGAKAKFVARQISPDTFMKYWEDKSTKVKKHNFDIKVPNAQKAINANRIQDDDGNKYDYDSVCQMINENGLFESDQEIVDTIKKYKEGQLKDTVGNVRNAFYSSANIKTKWANTSYASMTKQQRYFAWKTDEIRKTIDLMDRLTRLSQDVSLPELYDRLEQVKSDYHEVYSELYKKEAQYKSIQAQRIEETLEVSDNVLDEWVKNNLTPLQEKKLELNELYKNLQDSIAEKEKYVEQQERKGKIEAVISQ